MAAEDSRVNDLRNHLASSNGIKGLEILSPSQVERAVELFHRDGFAVIGDALNNEQIDILAIGCAEIVNEVIGLDADHKGNRGSHRYSFGVPV